MAAQTQGVGQMLLGGLLATLEGEFQGYRFEPTLIQGSDGIFTSVVIFDPQGKEFPEPWQGPLRPIQGVIDGVRRIIETETRRKT